MISLALSLEGSVRFNINRFRISLNDEINSKQLKKHNIKKLGYIGRSLIQPSENDIVYWAKNCILDYSIQDGRGQIKKNMIEPNLNAKYGPQAMFGTTAYIWYENRRLYKLIFQILQNEYAATEFLREFEQNLNFFQRRVLKIDSSEYSIWKEDCIIKIEVGGEQSSGRIIYGNASKLDFNE